MTSVLFYYMLQEISENRQTTSRSTNYELDDEVSYAFCVALEKTFSRINFDFEAYSFAIKLSRQLNCLASLYF